MKSIFFIIRLCMVSLAALLFATNTRAQFRSLPETFLYKGAEKLLNDSVIYHPVRVDSSGNILPWASGNYGKSFDQVLKLVWNFWKNMELDSNGIKYYMNHQVWKPEHDYRGIGGDQVMMALSSWDLLYNYTGDSSIIANMRYQADHYLSHSLSDPGSQWPDLPHPYNTKVESGIYDGDMRGTIGTLQPDKAGSLGFELVHLFKKTGDKKYLELAIKIANTLVSKFQKGTPDMSPWPFRVNSITGEIPDMGHNEQYPENHKADYTTNWTPTLCLLEELMMLNPTLKNNYKKVIDGTLLWLKKYPAVTNEWGPFFEDIVGFSNTQINAVTYAMYLMNHQRADKKWKITVAGIFDWVYRRLGNDEFIKHGVKVVNEQTVFQVPGNSHSARQASMELLYWTLTGDTSRVRNAIRQLSWATYMVDHDGKNRYPNDDIWMTDGYGDYVRHYLRAMAAAPELSPSGENHLLQTSSIVRQITYGSTRISYVTFDNRSTEILRLKTKPEKISVNGKQLPEKKIRGNIGWYWKNLDEGGVLEIKQQTGNQITIEL